MNCPKGEIMEEINLHRLLEYLCVEGHKDKIVEFAIWKLVCDNLDPKLSNSQRSDKVFDRCVDETNKWIKPDGE